MFQPPTWYCGMTASTTSELVSSAVRESERFVQKQFACVRIAARARSRVPEVKISSSASSSRTARRVTGSAVRRTGGTIVRSMPVMPRAPTASGFARRSRAASATEANSSSTSSRAGSARSSCSESSRGESRHDRGTSTSPAFAQAKNSTTWSALLPVIVAMRSPTP